MATERSQYTDRLYWMADSFSGRTANSIPTSKFLFMRNDMEEQEPGLPDRDCKIRLKSGQTTGILTVIPSLDSLLCCKKNCVSKILQNLFITLPKFHETSHLHLITIFIFLLNCLEFFGFDLI